MIRQKCQSDREVSLSILGDSNSLGLFAFDWPKRLEAIAFRQLQVRVVGGHGDLAYNSWLRLEKSLRIVRPDIVMVCTGTNDAIAQTSLKNSTLYRICKRLPESPTIAFFAKHLHLIIQIAIGCGAKVILTSLPPLGERLDDTANQLIADLNNAISSAREYYNCEMRDLHKELAERLGSATSKPTAFDVSLRTPIFAAFKKVVLKSSFESISRSNGLLLTTDTIHFNELSGRIVAELAKSTLQRCE